MATHGGARNRSGPQADPISGRSDRRGLTYTSLPREGRDGDAPDFPLPEASERELDLWEWAWTTPQAVAWEAEPWRWYTVAEWVRWSAKAERADATSATLTAVIRLADQIGLTPAGLRENGWAIGTEADEAAATVAGVTDIRTRLNGGS